MVVHRGTGGRRTGIDVSFRGGETSGPMGILARYVLAEMAKVFLISLVALTLLMIVVGVFREAQMQSLPLWQVVRLIPYVLPDALRVAVPVTLLLAAVVVYGRMSGSGEVVAVKTLGICPMVILWPTFIAAFLLSLATVWLNDLAVSWGRSGVQRVVIESVEEIAYGMLRAQRRYSSPNFAINVKRVDGRRLIRPTLSLPQRGNSPAITITAEEAELQSDRAEGVLRITLRNGTLEMADRLSIQFPDVYQQEVPLRDASRARRESLPPSWLSLRVISKEAAAAEQTVQQWERQLAARAAYQMLCGDLDGLTSRQWEPRIRLLERHRGHLHRLKTEPHRRWSAGFSCLCFVWVGAPMAIRLRKSDFLTSFFVCFAPILVVYYPLLAYGVDGAKNGTLPPYAVWVGNVLLGCWGGWLLRKVIRY